MKRESAVLQSEGVWRDNSGGRGTASAGDSERRSLECQQHRQRGSRSDHSGQAGGPGEQAGEVKGAAPALGGSSGFI